MNEPDPETRKLLLDLTRYRCDVQRAAFERVEAKAGILLAFAVTAAQFVVSRQIESGYRSWAVGAYVVAMVLALIVSGLRSHREIDPMKYLPALWDAAAERATTLMTNEFADAYRANLSGSTWRVWLWRLSAVALTTGAMLSVLHITRGTPT
jgi:hypothetical protein